MNGKKKQQEEGVEERGEVDKLTGGEDVYMNRGNKCMNE